MIYVNEERFLKILRVPHISEKVSILTEKTNTLALKVRKDATKIEIFNAVEALFKVKVLHVNTFIVKGKIKHYKKRIGRCSNWKKAYITLKKGEVLNFVGTCE
ncbi:50S ribosomal protein L23 [Candidatus Ishikawella capsulata]|uniref:Large ribosomal subunit protein uL23 n=1 Tax=Candidatus Ishikawaella capsulata Mpkobe TaxID=476281 RepID=C5WCQ7_9ENTR|nr:50S ribosomal protein L23 [Candidatus Ishikawaella capsulata]BAH83113.1 50S ribosomal protein L23 [Candidatus Ishikawaella capsulata Mpkobe]